MTHDPFAPIPGTGPKKGMRWTCCLEVFGVLVLIMIAGISLSVYAGYRYVNNLADTYLDAEPVALPELQLSQAEQDALWQRALDFKSALDGQGGARTLELTPAEINAVLRQVPNMGEFAQWVHVSIEDEQLTGQVSVPMDDFVGSMPGPLAALTAGKYLNGHATFSLSIADGHPKLYLRDLSVGGETVPEELMAGFGQENLAKELSADPEIAAYLRKLDEVRVEGGRLVLRLK